MTLTRALLLAGASLFLLGPAATQAQTSIGGQVSWADDADIGLGARAFLPIPALHPQLAFVPSFDVFFPGSDLSYWELNANIHYTFVTDNSNLSPYVGAGLNFARASARVGPVGRVSESEVGVNVLGGLRFPMGGFSPFVEARVELGGGEQFVLAGGLLFRVGGRR